MSIQVSPVKSPSERDAFIEFQWQIYRDDPAWVPPLIIERKEFLDRVKESIRLFDVWNMTTLVEDDQCSA